MTANYFPCWIKAVTFFHTHTQKHLQTSTIVGKESFSIIMKIKSLKQVLEHKN